jgi:hypothetical protein
VDSSTIRIGTSGIDHTIEIVSFGYSYKRLLEKNVDKVMCDLV